MFYCCREWEGSGEEQSHGGIWQSECWVSLRKPIYQREREREREREWEFCGVL